jgi:hypothetical protein
MPIHYHLETTPESVGAVIAHGRRELIEASYA